MFKSRKFVIWFSSFLAFVGLSILIVIVTKSADGLIGLGTSIALVSGVYYGANVSQKKILK